MMTWSVRRDIDWRALSLHLLAGIPGIPIGILILMHVHLAHYRNLFGGLVVICGIFALLRPRLTNHRFWRGTDLLVGFVSGITGGAAGLPGMPTVILCSIRGWSKERQRGLVQPFILIMQIITIIALAVIRNSVYEMMFGNSTILFVSASLLATCGGMALYSRLSDLQFARVVSALLLFSGLSLIA